MSLKGFFICEIPVFVGRLVTQVAAHWGGSPRRQGVRRREHPWRHGTRSVAHAPAYRTACASRSRPTAPPDISTLFYFPTERSQWNVYFHMNCNSKRKNVWVTARVSALWRCCLSRLQSCWNQNGRSETRGPWASLHLMVFVLECLVI